jgi:hypothetical protein
MRKLTAELLDHLPHDDPGAMRSRADLRRINFFAQGVREKNMIHVDTVIWRGRMRT